MVGKARIFTRMALVVAVACASIALNAQTPDAGTDASTHAVQRPEYDRRGTPKAPSNKTEARLADDAAAFAERQHACGQGRVAACGDLGEAYELGIGTEQNRPIASILYAEACDAGNAESCYRLGRVTLAATRDSAKVDAFQAFERACELGSLDGCASMADAYREGDGVVQDLELAAAIAADACAQGGGAACYSQASDIQISDPDGARADEVAELFNRSCANGYALGCRELIDGPLDGLVADIAPSQLELLRRACELGDPLSCLDLGDVAFRGDGTYRNDTAALRHYDRACYLDPDMCTRARDLRAEPIEYAACQNDDGSACARLAQLYFYPDTPLSDYDLAKAYYEYACYIGATEACPQAGRMVLDAQGAIGQGAVTQGLAYLERGCAADELSACSQLSGFYKSGQFVERDMQRHYQLQTKLCDANWGRSCRELEDAWLTDPEAPLIKAGIRYLPPIEPGDPSWRDRFISDEEREALQNLCSSSEIEFRGALYSDTVCEPQDRVIGGLEVRPGEAPWQALIWRPEQAFDMTLEGYNRVLCGGSLIAEGWILTAAHCLRDDEGWITRRGYTVRLGVLDPFEAEGITYPITRIYRHPRYNPRTYAFDIALIRFDQRNGRREGVTNPITAISTDDKTMEERTIRRGQPAYVYGFGRTRVDDARSTSRLLSAKLALESQARCNGITGFARELWNTMLCARGANNQQACDGDSGGPLITYGDADGIPRVIGVVSSGRKCGQGRTQEASRYVRVSEARDWIDETMGIAR